MTTAEVLHPVSEVFVIVPARLASKRLPRKIVLPDINGRSIISHVMETCLRFMQSLQYTFAIPATVRLAIANSDRNDTGIDRNFIIPTPNHCENGTMRVADAMRQIQDQRQTEFGHAMVLHVQADMPDLTVDHLHQLLRTARQYPGCDLATLGTATITQAQQDSPSTVKVRVGEGGYAYQFTRRPAGVCRRHVGLYAYRPDYLRWYETLKLGHNGDEDLEQYRVMAAGGRVRVGTIDAAPASIDTQDDYLAWHARQRLKMVDEDRLAKARLAAAQESIPSESEEVVSTGG